MTVDDVLKQARAMSTPEQRREMVLEFDQRVEVADEFLGLTGIPDHELRAICSQVMSRLQHASAAWISIVTDKRQYVRAAVGADFVVELEGEDMPLANSLCAQVVMDMDPIVAPDVKANPLLAVCAVSPLFEAYVGVPLHFHGATVGVLAITGKRGSLNAGVLPVLQYEVTQIEDRMLERRET
jgi:GAF domain-containing protein